MDFFYADDSKQENPTRPGMGPIVSIGGIYIPEGSVQNLKEKIETLCDETGFPSGEEFKWSPGRELWMRDNLIEDKRKGFFREVLNLTIDADGKAIVVVADVSKRSATGARTAQEDVTKMFLERAEKLLLRVGSYGIIFTDRPRGDRREEKKFLTDCTKILKEGTEFVKFKQIIQPIYTVPSTTDRLLQVADIVTSCTTAMVAGENQYAPPVFEVIRKMLDHADNRTRGIGLKIHPDSRYVNLYHWLTGDSFFRKPNYEFSLPKKGYPYSNSPYLN